MHADKNARQIVNLKETLEALNTREFSLTGPDGQVRGRVGWHCCAHAAVVAVLHSSTECCCPLAHMQVLFTRIEARTHSFGASVSVLVMPHVA